MTCWKPSALLKSHTCTLEHVFPNHMFILTAPTMTGPTTIFCVALECVSVCLSYLKLSLSLWWRETAFFCASSARAQVECEWVCVCLCVCGRAEKNPMKRFESCYITSYVKLDWFLQCYKRSLETSRVACVGRLCTGTLCVQGCITLI